jgi:integrase
MPLYKRPDSPVWWVRIGRKTRKSTGTEDREAAEEFERVLTERLWRREKLGDRGAVSWVEASERWVNDSARPKKRDRELLAWLEPRIGQYPVSAITDPDALEELRKDGLADGWSQSTVDRMMGTVSAVLKACATWRYIEYAPTVPMYRPGLEEPRWLTPEEMERLCAELPMHLVLAARFAVATLLRMRAMLKLTWDRVNLAEQRAWVPRAHQKAGRTFGLPLSSEAIRVLRAVRWLSPPSSAYIFTWRGEPIDDCNTLAFQEAVERAGLAPFRWHDLRHTGASWAVQSGVTLPELMVIGDWRDYRSVLRYAHLAPSHAAQAAEKMAQFGQQVTVKKRRKLA